MSFTEINPELIDQLQPPVTLIKTEPLTVVKSEPPEHEIDIDDMFDSPEEIFIPDIKNIDIVSNLIYEGLIKSETVPESLLENKDSTFVETQVILKSENAPFIKTENLIEDINALGNLETDQQLALNFSNDLNCISSGHPEKKDFAESHRTCEINSLEKDEEIIKIIKAPVIPVEPHEYTSLANGKHVCNHCQCACNRLNDLKIHITKLHREVNTMYQCPYCSFKSKWRMSLQNHIILKHKDSEEIQWFKCRICEMKFKLSCQLARHKLTHLTQDQMQDKLKFCPVCRKGFITKSKVNAHVKFVHNKEPAKRLKCQECDYTSSASHLLKHHVKTHHMGFQQSYECSECDFKAKYKSRLERHKRKHEKRYCCDKCNYITHVAQNLDRHKLIHLNPEEIQYFYCYHCSHKSKRRSDIIAHISKHFRNGDVSFHCYLCDFKTLKRNLLSKHIKNHAKFKPHELPDEAETEMDDQNLKHHCNKCSYRTYARQKLKIHKITHLKPEEIQYFYCPHCSYKCKLKGNLKPHIFRHFKNGEIELNNKCDETKYKFKLQKTETYKTETDMDDQDLKYHCDKCNYKTYLRQNLNRHKFTHLKPEEIQYFYCYHCSVKYKHKQKLKIHILKHFKNGEVAFHCYICDFMTLNRGSITEHIEEHSKVQIKLEIKEES